MPGCPLLGTGRATTTNTFSIEHQLRRQSVLPIFHLNFTVSMLKESFDRPAFDWTLPVSPMTPKTGTMVVEQSTTNSDQFNLLESTAMQLNHDISELSIQNTNCSGDSEQRQDCVSVCLNTYECPLQHRSILISHFDSLPLLFYGVRKLSIMMMIVNCHQAVPVPR
jgi:hypothetical protein